MKIRSLHPWRVSYAEAVALQESLRRRLRLTPLPKRVRRVAGTDVAYSKPTHRMYAAVVVVRLPGFEVEEVVTADVAARFPYIPGLFTFREVPPLLAAFAKLRTRPDVVLFDGQGLAHPRRFGLACHGGLLLNLPSVGCAKSRLVGEHSVPGTGRGAWTPLRLDGETIGAVVRTRAQVSPVFVSPGHRADVTTAVALVSSCAARYRLPEPIRLAHRETTRLMRERDPRHPRVADRRYPDFVAG